MHRLGRILAITLGLAWVAPTAMANVTVVAPSDWVKGGAADPSANERATRWASALGGILVSVHASSGRDDFVETMALVQREAAMPADIVDDSDAAARWLDGELAQITGGAPAQEMAWERTPNLQAGFVHATYNMADVRLVVAAVPDGARTTFLLMASRTNEELFYGPIFDDVRASLDGGAAPIHPFDIAGHRKRNIIGWIIALLAGYGISLAAFSERRGDHRRVGRIAAMLLSVGAIGAGIFAVMRLKSHTASLEVVGSSAGSLATEVFGAGALAAGIAFIVGQLLERGEQRVRSAPAVADLNARIQAAQAEQGERDA